MGESRAQIETCRKASPGGADTAGSARLPGSTDCSVGTLGSLDATHKPKVGPLGTQQERPPLFLGQRTKDESITR